VIKAAVVKPYTHDVKVGLPAQTGTRAGFLSGGAGDFPSSRTLKTNLVAVESPEVLGAVIKAA